MIVSTARSVEPVAVPAALLACSARNCSKSLLLTLIQRLGPLHQRLVNKEFDRPLSRVGVVVSELVVTPRRNKVDGVALGTLCAVLVKVHACAGGGPDAGTVVLSVHKPEQADWDTL